MTGKHESTKLILTATISPTKVSLLALIAAYCSGLLPSSWLPPILSVLVKFIENDDLFDYNEQRVIIPSLGDLIFNLKDSIVKTVSDSPAREKTAAQSDANKIESRLLNALWSIQSVEDLNNFVIRAKSLIVENSKSAKELLSKVDEESIPKKLLTKRSFLGSFVNNLIISFEVIEFENLLSFFKSFQQYREESRDDFLRMGGVIEQNVDEENDLSAIKKLAESITRYVTFEEKSDNLLVVPREDLEYLLKRQIHLLEAYGTSTPKKLSQILKLMSVGPSSANMQSNYYLSNYYLKYLEFLKDSDYEGAFQALHQYFDYMVSSNSKIFYHYALLSLSTLHAHFGNDKESLRAIEEAISVARENKDNSCLNYLLTWLFNFLQNRPELWVEQNFYNNNNSEQLLLFLIKKSKDTSLSLYSMSFQFEIIQNMNNGGPISQVFESLIKASYVAINDNYTTFIKNCELQSSLWNKVGFTELSDVYCEIALDACKENKNMSDELAVVIRKSYLDYGKGNIDTALETLENIKKLVKKDDTLFKSWESRRLLLLIKTSLNKNRLQFAWNLIEKLKTQNIIELDLQYEILVLEIEYHILIHNNFKAFQLANNQLIKLNKTQNQVNKYWVVKFNLLICEIYCSSNVPSRCVSIILKQINKSVKLGYVSLLIECTIILVQILLILKNYDDCSKLLDSLMPIILTSNNIEIKAKIYKILSQINLETFNSKHYKSLSSKILNYLEISINGFKKISNFKEMRSCFQIQLKLSELIKSNELYSHANDAISKIDKRIREESGYGMI